MLRRSIKLTWDLYMPLLQIFQERFRPETRKTPDDYEATFHRIEKREEARRSSGQNTAGRGRSEESMSGVKRTWVYNKKYPTQSRSE